MSINLKKTSKRAAESIIAEVFAPKKKGTVLPTTIQNTICAYLQPAALEKRKGISSKVSIAKDYEVVFQSKKIKSPQKAKIFLLGEVHTMTKCKEINKTFIQETAPEGGVLILEGFPTNLGVIDDEDSLAVINENHLLDKPFLEKCRIVGWDFKDVVLLDNILKEEQAKQGPIGKSGLSYSQFVREMILMTFPERTQSMINTLRSVDQWAKKNHFAGKIFLIAGDSHLKTIKAFENDSRASPKALYKALEKYAAVVLVPKVISETYGD